MAKKKTKKSKPAKKGKGRSVGALSLQKDQDLLMLAGGVLAGAVVKRLADNIIAKQATSTGVTIEQGTVDLIQGAGGAAIFYFLDQPFVRGLGLGLVGSVVYNKTKDLKLAGIGQSTVLVPFRPQPNLNGVTQTPSVAGASTNVYSFPQPAGVGRMRRNAYASHLK